MTNLIRLNKFLADSGVCSRRKADEHICNGEVLVNNKKAKVGEKINSDLDKVFFKNKLVKCNQKKIYLAFYKPVGITSTLKKQNSEKNLLSFVKLQERVYPIGRLDKESEGLMILTNDGDLTKKITHPSFKHQKEYQVFAEDQSKTITAKKLKEKFEKGVKIKKILMKADSINDIEISGRRVKFKIILHTGYNRQIRRMSGIIKLRIEKIIRTRLANLKLIDLNLRPGEYKVITLKEIL